MKRRFVWVMVILMTLSLIPLVTVQAAESTLDRILAEGKIVIGCSLSGMPIGGYDEEGNPTGYDVDWAHRLAEVLGVELEIVDVNGDTRIPALTSGQIDVIIANITVKASVDMVRTRPDPVVSERSMVFTPSTVTRTHLTN